MKQISIKLLEGPLLRDATAVHFATDNELDQAKEMGVPMNEFVLPLGFELDQIKPDISEIEADRYFPRLNDRLVILFLSRIDPIKSLDTLISAFAEISQINQKAILVIAGEGESTYVDQLKTLASQFDLGERICWVGFVDGPRKAALWKLADIFVLPSQSENFGVVIVEALAAGVPIITTEGVAINHLLKQYKAGRIIPVLDVDSLRDSINYFLDNPEERDKVASRGVQLVHDHFSIEKVGNDLLRTYQRLLATGS